MMSRLAPRLHRLPQRLDYTLVPAPLDLSLPLATEKSPLPAIIVTPSSPSCSSDFSIAFLAPPPKPSLRERISSYTESFQDKFQFKARTTIIFVLLMFIMACHVLTHRLAMRRPHLEFSQLREPVGDAHVAESPFEDWLDVGSLWGSSIADGKRDFFIAEPNAAS